jgi:rhodanese-related sulfurtransferase/mono/diheme cytochrome c family protein
MDWLIEKSGLKRKPISDTPVVGDPISGAEQYKTHCAECHGERGEGGSGTALANPVFLATASDAFIRHTVANGRDGTPMLAFTERLSETQIDDVVAFLRSRAMGWEATAPILAPPPDPANAVLNPQASAAKLEEREGRFVSAKSVAAAMERGERMVLLDARPMSDWQRSHLPGALPMPFYDGVEALVPHLPNDDTPIIAYCACPHAASGRVVDALKNAGFSSARILDEGILVWAGLGYPTAIGKDPSIKP